MWVSLEIASVMTNKRAISHLHVAVCLSPECQVPLMLHLHRTRTRDSTYMGLTWRLPTIKELIDLVVSMDTRRGAYVATISSKQAVTNEIAWAGLCKPTVASIGRAVCAVTLPRCH